jgi:hypothetical protein
MNDLDDLITKVNIILGRPENAYSEVIGMCKGNIHLDFNRPRGGYQLREIISTNGATRSELFGLGHDHRLKPKEMRYFLEGVVGTLQFRCREY